MPVRPGGVWVPHREGSCMWREVLNSPGTTSAGAPISFLPQLPVSDGQHLGSDTCSLGIGNMNYLNTRLLGPALRMGSSVPTLAAEVGVSGGTVPCLWSVYPAWGSVPRVAFCPCATTAKACALEPVPCSESVLGHFGRVRLFVTPWTVARQAPLSVGFSRQEYWSGWPCRPPGDLLHLGTESASLVSWIAGQFFTAKTTWAAPATEKLL